MSSRDKKSITLVCGQTLPDRKLVDWKFWRSTGMLLSLADFFSFIRIYIFEIHSYCCTLWIFHLLFEYFININIMHIDQLYLSFASLCHSHISTSTPPPTLCNLFLFIFHTIESDQSFPSLHSFQLLSLQVLLLLCFSSNKSRNIKQKRCSYYAQYNYAVLK